MHEFHSQNCSSSRKLYEHIGNSIQFKSISFYNSEAIAKT